MDNNAMNKALIGVQKCVLKATKDGTNTFFGNSKYATLDSILEAIRGPLTENGFALVQDATTGDMSVSVVTRLLHESGAELVSPPLSAPLKKEFTKTGVELPPSVQQIGSLVTYLRRYSLCPFLGVALDDDDDGNMASQIGKEGQGNGTDRTNKTDGTKSADGTEKRLTSPLQTGAEKQPGTQQVGNRKSAHTGEALNTPEAVERHKAAAQAGGQRSEIGGQRSEGEAPHGATTNVNGGREKCISAECGSSLVGDGGKAGKTPEVPPQDIMAFNTRLYDAMERDKITEAEITGYLNGTAGKPRIARPVLAGNMTIHNLGERIADALVSGTDTHRADAWLRQPDREACETVRRASVRRSAREERAGARRNGQSACRLRIGGTQRGRSGP
jgi:hypothetical protein